MLSCVMLYDAGCLDTVEPAVRVDSLYPPVRWWWEHRAMFTTWRWVSLHDRWAHLDRNIMKRLTGSSVLFSVSPVRPAGTAWSLVTAFTTLTGLSSVNMTDREQVCSVDIRLRCRLTAWCRTRRWGTVALIGYFLAPRLAVSAHCPKAPLSALRVELWARTHESIL